jgi:hypothetical protein
MNILQLFTTTNPQSVVDVYNEKYPQDDTLELQAYRDFIADITSKIVTTTGNIIEISHMENRVDGDDDEKNHSYIDVSMLVDSVRHSVAFGSWSEILGCEILCSVPTEMGLDEQAAHVYWEITWYGTEEESWR